MDWTQLSQFEYQDVKVGIEFVETLQVKDGVVCHVYRFQLDDSRDLAIVEVETGSCRTPLQRIRGGDETIEGHLSGKGTLTITATDGNMHIYEYHQSQSCVVAVSRGELMQWFADTPEPLVFFADMHAAIRGGPFRELVTWTVHLFYRAEHD